MRSLLAMHPGGVKGEDVRLDRGAVGDSRRPCTAGKACDKGLVALEALDIKPLQFLEWLGMIVDSQVEEGIRLGGAAQERDGLVAALVATRGLSRHHRRHQALGEGKVAR